MNLKEKFNQENDFQKNIVPLGNNEIKSILKTQSEAVFQDKNLTNNSNFIKKSLIDIAMDFKSKEGNKENLENTENIKEEGAEPKKNENIEEISTEDLNQKEKTARGDTTNETDKTGELDNLSDQSSSEPELIDQNNDQLNKTSNDLNTENNQSDNIIETSSEIDTENVNIQNQDQIDKNEIISDTDTKIDETQQALDSVRDAVSQSLNQSNNENEKIANESKETQNDISEIISKDFDQFKNIFSSLSSLSEKAIYDAMESKIIDIAKNWQVTKLIKCQKNMKKK